MHIDVGKYLFIGTKKRKSDFFQACQAMGYVQFIKNRKLLLSQLQELLSLYSQAVRILKHYGNPEESRGEVAQPYEFCKDVIGLENRKEALIIQIKQLSHQLNELAPLGDIPFQDLINLRSTSSLIPRLWIASSSKRADALSSHFIFLTRNGPNEYFISFSHEVQHIPGVREIVLDEKTASLKQEFSKAKEELTSIELELKERADWLYSLRLSFINMMNTTRREFIEREAKTPLEDHLFAIQGWIPKDKLAQVQTLCDQHDILLEPLDPDKEEIIPTYLENKGFSRIGEDLVSIYDTPSYTDLDPSLWVLGFFSLFFAFIVNDAGYGLVFLLTSLFLLFRKKKKPLSSGGKRSLKLLAILGISCITWGCVTQSFFGLELEKDNPLHSLSIIDPLLEMHAKYHMDQEDEVWQSWIVNHKDIQTPTLDEFLYSPTTSGAVFAEVFKGHLLFEMALLFGMIHILIGMARYLFRNPAFGGWMIFMIGAYMFLPKMIGTTSIVQHLAHCTQAQFVLWGKQLMIIGFSLAILFSLLRHGLSGLLEAITDPIRIFGDVLSYLRLYALGLSGAIVAAMINKLSHEIPQIIAWVLIPICHSGNMVISIFGGVIHGLRLNFLEWYHYSFIGGGKPFTPLTFEKVE